MFAYLRLLLLTACNIISLEYNNTNVVAYTTLLTACLQVCIKCMNLLYALYYIYKYTGAHLSKRPMFTVSITLIGQSIMHVLNINILHACNL